ncbi:MAG: hypothetical protein Q8P41_02340 [Pseudomonadota bacterium]|nr:hypothetical protein [Pseudomonadota bacterium]
MLPAMCALEVVAPVHDDDDALVGYEPSGLPKTGLTIHLPFILAPRTSTTGR